MSKCKGCGVKLQYDDPNKIGYTPKEDGKYCQRCFRLTNYHEKSIVASTISDTKILSSINAKKIFTFFLVDLLNLNNKVIDLYNKITNNKVLVITKVDTLNNNFEPEFLKRRIKKAYGVNEVLFFSKVSGYGKNEILNICDEKQKVILAGPTSSGKSSLINYLFSENLTVSEYQNTTQDFISIKSGNNLVIDAPGFNEMFNAEEMVLKKKINPKTLTLKKEYALIIDNFVITTVKDTSMSLYFPEDIPIKTKKKRQDYENKISLKAKCDLVIYSKGFIYFKDACDITINTMNNTETRESVVVIDE